MLLLLRSLLDGAYIPPEPPPEDIAIMATPKGGGLKTRRRIIGMHPMQYPVAPVEEDEALLLVGLI